MNNVTIKNFRQLRNAKVLAIHTGEILSVVIESYTSSVNGKPVSRMYFDSDLKRDGTPDRRANGVLLGITKGRCGFYGRFVELPEGEEGKALLQKAAAVRAEVEELQRKLDEKEDLLNEMFVGR